MRPSLLLDGRYRLESELGHGGMSVVWRATDEVLDRAVAVKFLGDGWTGGEDARTTIRREARAAARLCHPHIARVYDFGEAEDVDGTGPVSYLVLELLIGQSLSELLAVGPLPTALGLAVAADVAGALTAAHADGLVHRDVKPGNIMVTSHGAKVFDFGIAAAVGATDVGDELGRILGTPSYVAPERLAGATVTAAADMYAFGVLLGRLFGAASSSTPQQSTVLGRAPVAVERLRRRCLAADPATRPNAAQAERVLVDARSRPWVQRSPHVGVAAVRGVDAGAGGLPATGYLPPPLWTRLRWPGLRSSGLRSSGLPWPRLNSSRFESPHGSPVGSGWRHSLTAVAVLSIAAGLSCLVAAVDTTARTSAVLPEAAPAAGAPEAATSTAPPVAATTAAPVPPAPVAPAPVAPAPLAPAAVGPTPTVFSSAGATVSAACRSGRAYLSAWTPQAGYRVHRVNQGPALIATVEFRRDRGGSDPLTFAVSCRDGVPRARIFD